jgi:methionyl-tRNA synthetase
MTSDQFPVWFPIVMVLLMLWTIPWKAVALWKSARNNDLAWFIILMIVNTLGVLEILYIFLFSKKISKKSE